MMYIYLSDLNWTVFGKKQKFLLIQQLFAKPMSYGHSAAYFLYIITFYSHKNLNGVNGGILIYKRRNQTQGTKAYKTQT